MPLIATRGAASAQGFGEFAQSAAVTYIEDVFSTWLYNGDTGGFIFASSGVSIVSGGMMWVKSRGSATNNYVFSPSLTNANYYLNTNTTAAQSNSGVSNNNFEAVDNGGGMRFGGAYSGISDSATGPYTSWTFRKQPKFFDVVTYTGTGGSLTVNHNLGSTPGCIIVKRINSTSDWFVHHQDVNYDGSYLKLNSTAANNSGSVPPYFLISVTDTYFTMQATGVANVSGATYVAYLFAHDAGGFGLTGTDNVISCGSYTGNGSATGPVVTLGYEPQWLLVKQSSNTGNWFLADTMRGFNVTNDQLLRANTTGAEYTVTNYVKPLATGFQIVNADFDVNESGGTYIYIAIRRGPMKVPTSGTSVFSPNAVTMTASGSATITTNFPVDLSFNRRRSSADQYVMDRLRGGSQTFYNYLRTQTTGAETTGSSIGVGFDNNTALVDNNWQSGVSSNTIWWSFRRAPGFFDEVCYTGTGSATTFSHNLAVVPELMIVKRRNSTGFWAVYTAATGAANVLELQSTNASTSGSAWNSTSPTASVFTVGNTVATGASGGTYVAYLFATCAGVSKVGSYTGTGAAQTINCGFTGGSRFVLIKRTDSTGDWYVWDSARGIIPANDPYLLLNSTAAEVTGTDYVDTTSVGFDITSTAPAAINANGGTFIFLAIA